MPNSDASSHPQTKKHSDLQGPVATTIDTSKIDLAALRSKVFSRVPHLNRQRSTLLGLTALTLLALWVRWELQHTWFWIDEGLSVGISGHGFFEIPKVLHHDGSPPLYYWLLWAWMKPFGTSEFATHMLSLLFGLACVPVSFWGTAKIADQRAGWMAALVSATIPYLTYYAAETRMYSLLTFEALVFTILFILVFAQGQRQYRVGLTASVIALLYTHNWALFSIATAAMFWLVLLWFLPMRRKAVLQDGVFVWGISLLAWLPWVPTLIFQVRHTGAPWSRTPVFREIFSQVSKVMGDERSLVLIGVVAGGGLLTWMASGLRTRIAIAGYLVAAASIPVLMAWTISQSNPNWADRYFGVLVGPIALLIGIGFTRARFQGALATLALMLIWLHPLGRITGAREPASPWLKSNIKAVVEASEPFVGANDLILVGHPEQIPLIRYYLGPEYRYADQMGEVADPTYFDWVDVTDHLEAANPQANLIPLIDSLRSGQHLLFLWPVVPTDEATPPWVTLFLDKSATWRETLANSEDLVEIGRIGNPAENPTGTSMFGVVYEKK